jgi:[ribosomal protein S18]-alanine N-acetyltransferase
VRLVVLDYGLHALDPAFYRQVGFLLVERIVEFERPDLPIAPRRSNALSVRRYRPGDREAVLELERESFPWLWWNSPEEWDSYLLTRGVEVLVGCLDGRIVGYAGFVVYHHDGHLDRLAVREAEQGRGFGRALLIDSLARMRERGARRVALTTQEDNVRSQALYLANGFHRSRWTYEIHGRWLGPEADRDDGESGT